MKDLPSLVQHPSCQGADAIILASNAPITLVRGDAQKPLGKPLSTQQLLGLLKASLPAEAMTGFQWGKELAPQLQVDGRSLPMRVNLGVDKTMRIDIQLTQAAQPAAPVASAPTPTSAAADVTVDQSQFDQLTRGENLALLYGANARALEDAVRSLGFEPKHHDDPALITEALRYHSFPLVVLGPETDYRQDPVYSFVRDDNMSRRRRSITVLIAQGLVSDDDRQAFGLSVDLTIDANAADQADLEAAISRRRLQTDTFHQCLEAAGH